MVTDTFPYTEEISFFKVVSIRHGLIQIFPPSNWKDCFDYFGFHAIGNPKTNTRFPDTYISLFLKKEDSNYANFTIALGNNFFINYKKSIIYAVPGSFKLEK